MVSIKIYFKYKRFRILAQAKLVLFKYTPKYHGYQLQ